MTVSASETAVSVADASISDTEMTVSDTEMAVLVRETIIFSDFRTRQRRAQLPRVRRLMAACTSAPANLSRGPPQKANQLLLSCNPHPGIVP